MLLCTAYISTVLVFSSTDITMMATVDGKFADLYIIIVITVIITSV